MEVSGIYGSVYMGGGVTEGGRKLGREGGKKRGIVMEGERGWREGGREEGREEGRKKEG